MRKITFRHFRVSILVALSLLAMPSYAQYYFDFGYSEDSVVYVDATATEYTIDFQLNMDSLQEVFHSASFSIGNFSTLDLPKPYYFDYMDSVGCPMLPVRRIYLEVPEGFDMELSFSYLSITYDYVDLQKPYLPFQNTRKDTINDFMYNHDAYSSSPDWTIDNLVTISPYFHYFDEKGFFMEIHPYSYDPLNDRVRVIKKMQAKIPLVEGHPGNYNDLTTLRIFDWHTYVKELRDSIGHHQESPERILIVTPEEYLDELEDYITYRQHQHFYVSTLTLEQIASTYSLSVNELTSPYIIAAINGKYLTSSPKPKYLILVGDTTVIPYSAGVSGNSSNPATDYYYALVNPTSCTLTMLMAVGRWPVGSNHGDQVTTIIKNIKEFESDVADFPHKSDMPVDMVSGSGAYELTMYLDLKYTYRSIKSTYHTTFYDGRDYHDCDLYSTIRGDLVDDLWMLIYSGHANSSGLGEPLCYYENIIKNLKHTLRPMVFAFACKTNSGTFGTKWILHPLQYSDSLHCQNSDYGCVSFFGSTTNSTIPEDRFYTKSIFTNFNYARLGKALVAGAQKYYPTGAENQIKRYVFLGDPALCYHGYPRSTPLESPQHEPNSQYDGPQISINQQQIELHINEQNESQTHISVYDVTGKLHYKADDAEHTKINMEFWPAGVYIVRISGRESSYMYKIINIR